MTIMDTRAAMSSASINDLPDSAFAYIEDGGTKDAEGKTTPRSLRHFPVHDEAHARNALARLSTSPFGDKARPKVLAACKKFGIEVDESKTADQARFELRRRRRGSMIRRAERRGMTLEMRAKPNGSGGTDFLFTGYGSVFDAPFEMWDPWGDPYTEIVRPGAFSRSLARPELDVPFLIGHNDAGIPLARTRNGTLTLSQDTRGLLVEARMDGGRSDVRNLASAVERGDMDEMSIGFVTMGQEWSPDWETRAMLDLELHRGDVSAVALGASSATAGSTMVTLSAGRPGERRTPTQPYSAHDGETNECPVCHSVNADSARHCDQCGHAMQPKAGLNNMTGVEDMSQQCSSCSGWNSADAKYCGSYEHELAGAMGAGADRWSAAGAGERRGAFQADYTDAPDYDPAPHAAPGSMQCPSSSCTVAGGALNAPDAKYCDQCGGALYDTDGKIVIDDQGVPIQSESGDSLALRRWRLELLKLAG